jgi:holin-like protein
MALLFTFLALRARVPDSLDRLADGLLANLSLLFVPAGVGVMLHLPLVAREWLPIAASLVVSTLATIAVTALVMRALAPPEREEPGAGEAP